MSARKRFDCVETKNAIQAKLAREFAGMTAEEEATESWRRAGSDPILGDWLRRWRLAHGDASPRVARAVSATGRS